MTAQMHDRVNLQGREYELAGINGTELFNPEKFGINPVGYSSACWRGFLCHYAVQKDVLILDNLQVSYGHLGRTKFTHKRCPEINNVSSTYTKVGSSSFNNVYENLNLTMEFTGGILIANNINYKLCVNMGFKPAWKYQTVYELMFENGQVRNIKDVSQTMKDIREEMIKQPLEPGRDASYMESARWVNSTFSLIYSHKNGEYELNIGKEPEEDLSGLSLSERLERLGRLPDDSDEPDDD